MDIKQMRRLQLRQFKLHLDGEWLAEWLNDATKFTWRATIAELVQNMTGFVLAAKVDSVGRARVPVRNAMPSLEESRKILDSMLRALYPIKIRPALNSANEFHPGLWWAFDWVYLPPEGWPGYEEIEKDHSGGQALESIARLGEAGWLDRVRKCRRCLRWMCARRDWQWFCSAQCREKAYRTGSEGRRKRREYMRGYRARIKRYDENHFKFLKTAGKDD